MPFPRTDGDATANQMTVNDMAADNNNTMANNKNKQQSTRVNNIVIILLFYFKLSITFQKANVY